MDFIKIISSTIISFSLISCISNHKSKTILKVNQTIDCMQGEYNLYVKSVKIDEVELNKSETRLIIRVDTMYYFYPYSKNTICDTYTFRIQSEINNKLNGEKIKCGPNELFLEKYELNAHNIPTQYYLTYCDETGFGLNYFGTNHFWVYRRY